MIKRLRDLRSIIRSSKVNDEKRAVTGICSGRVQQSLDRMWRRKRIEKPSLESQKMVLGYVSVCNYELTLLV